MVRERRDLIAGNLAAWVVPHRLWEARRVLERLRSGGCSVRRSVRIAFSGTRTNALANTRLGLLPGDALDRIRVVVDVGANVGDWTAGILGLTEPAEVFAFEPAPDVFPILRDRLASHRSVTLIQAAVGDRDGSVPFHVTRHSHNASVLRPRQETQNLIDHGGDVRTKVDTDMIRLDTALAAVGRIDVLKIDVQGFERAVLAGGGETLSKTAYVLIEANFVSLYEGDLLLPELNSLMVEAGFTLGNLSQPYVRNGRALFTDALYRRTND